MSNNKRKTTEQFINECKLIYNDLYDYKLVNYKNNHIKVNIICKIHNEIWQTPKSLLKGIGCNLCSKRARHTNYSFIQKCNIIHNNKYDYSLTNFINSNKNIEIICPINNHGSFIQRPYNHLNGVGCAKCAKNLYLTKEEFIKRVILLNNNKYDYSLVKYKTARDKVKIICKKHGIFEQVAHSHLIDKQCIKCSNNISKKEKVWLDLIEKQNNIILYRQYSIKNIKGFVDGFCKETNTVYEFFGDYFHGNPLIYNANDLNKKVKKSFGTLYNNTINKINMIKSLNYNLIYIWENDFNKLIKEI